MKKFLSLVLVLILILSMVACEQNKEHSTDIESDKAIQYPLTLVDQAGREITIEEEPKTLVSAYYISTSMLIALDLDERLVGVETEPEKRPIYKLSAPHILELPWIGNVKEFDVEGCAALNPDLVILPMKLKDTVGILEDLGMNVLLINPESQELLEESIRLIAEANNVKDRADELLSWINNQKEGLEKMLEETESPTVYLAGNSNLLSTAGDQMYQSNMIRLAHGKNVAAEIQDTYWAQTDYEQLMAWDPAYIILAADAVYNVDDVLKNPNLIYCDAVKNKRVYKMPNKAEAWDSPVPSGILGSIWMTNTLHPELMTDEDYGAIIDEYYEKFYGFTYSQI